MVIMERLSMRTADVEFNHKDLPSSVVEDVRNALQEIHKVGLVYGDVCRPNIMVWTEAKQWRAKLIDFDHSERVASNAQDAGADNTHQDEAGGILYDCFIPPDDLITARKPSMEMRIEYDIKMLESIKFADKAVWMAVPGSASIICTKT